MLRACLRSNSTVSRSSLILRISSLHLASRWSYNPPSAPRLPNAAWSARRRSSSLDSELPSEPPVDEPELDKRRSARDTLLARETRRREATWWNEVRRFAIAGECTSAGSRRIDLEVTACNLVEWDGAAMRTRVASVWRSRAWNLLKNTSSVHQTHHKECES